MTRVFILLLIIQLSPMMASAQEDSTLVNRQDSVEYLTPHEYAMMLDQDVRLLFRASVISVGLEWAFVDNFSLFAQVGYSEDVFEREFIKGELRYYLPLKSVFRANLSGLYVSAGAKLFNADRSSLRSTFSSGGLNASIIYANLGFQRRFLGNGLADFGLRFGFQNEDNYGYQDGNDVRVGSTQSFVLESKTSIGLGLSFGKTSALDYDRLCPVLKCYDTERFLLKVNLSDAIKIESDDELFNLWLQPSAAAELKLGNLPFSVQMKVALDQRFMVYSPVDYPRAKANFTFMEVSLESRYYYNLNSRIRTGKTGNSLSANYVAAGYLDKSAWFNQNERYSSFFERGGFYVTTGFQRTFGERLYFDVYLGASYIQDGLNPSRYFDLKGGVECGIKF